MDIPGIPDSIPRAKMIELVKVCGIDPNNLLSFEVKRDAVHAEVCALDEKGRRYFDDGKNVATHRIAIPITD